MNGRALIKGLKVYALCTEFVMSVMSAKPDDLASVVY